MKIKILILILFVIMVCSCHCKSINMYPEIEVTLKDGTIIKHCSRIYSYEVTAIECGDFIYPLHEIKYIKYTYKNKEGEENGN